MNNIAWIITIILGVLKLTEYIEVSWLIVFTPVLIVYGVALIIFLVTSLILGIALLKSSGKDIRWR